MWQCWSEGKQANIRSISGEEMVLGFYSVVRGVMGVFTG